ncbi:unnamed protein product, partial [Tetraodon nigroviridis]
WQSDPCYAFYGVDGTPCSILTYLSKIEDFCPPPHGSSRLAPPWHQQPPSYTEKSEIRTNLRPLYEDLGNSSSPTVDFIRSRVKRMSVRWIQAGLRMKQKVNNMDSKRMRVHSFKFYQKTMVKRGGPLGELVQWADLSACLTILGHNLTFSTSRQHLHSLIGAPPGRGSCPIQRPLTFDLIYTDYHGLAHLHGAMGLAFPHYQCRFRILDSFGTEPVFNLDTYARSHGYKTLWGSWALQPLQYMTMFPCREMEASWTRWAFLEHCLFVLLRVEGVRDGCRLMARKGQQSRETKRREQEKVLDFRELISRSSYPLTLLTTPSWDLGKSKDVGLISEELETHGTVCQPPGHSSTVPSFIRNHGLLPQEDFLRLMRRAKVFVGLGFPYEGPAPIEAISLGCVFLQPRFSATHSSDNFLPAPVRGNIHWQTPRVDSGPDQQDRRAPGAPSHTTHRGDGQHNSAFTVYFIRRCINPHSKVVWGILQVEPFTPREFTCEGMLERVHAYVTHQNFCSKSVPVWPPQSALRLHLGPLGQSCVDVCQRSSLVCEPALFHHINSPAAFSRLGIGCSTMGQGVNHLFPSYSPWGRHCSLQQELLLFSCAGSDPKHRRLCPCRAHIPGQVALCPDCI